MAPRGPEVGGSTHPAAVVRALEAVPDSGITDDGTLALVRDALGDGDTAGRDEAVRTLVDRLMPVIQARIARALLRRHSDLGPTRARALLEDLVQEVFLALFEQDGRTLRRWDPERGASLENFVGLVAERKVISHFRRDPTRDEDELPETFELSDPAPQASPERRTVSRRRLRRLVAHFRSELSPLGWTLFEMLFVWEGSVREVSEELGMSTEAVRKWRTRLRASARRFMAIEEGGESRG